MRLVFVSVLPLWSGGEHEIGGPAFYRTVRAYLARGHEVHLITLDPSAARYHSGNLHVHVVGGNLARLPNRLWVNYLRYSVVFPLSALICFLRLRRRQRLDIIYGYEVEGIVAAFPMSAISRRPLVSRFQGTVLAPLLKPGTPLKSRLPFVSHLLAFKVPADLAIMTDDGTLGAEVIRRLNPRLAARTRFWRNGIDPHTAEHGSAGLRAELGLRPDTPVLLTVSRLVGWKRVDRAIAALPAILREVPATVLAIAGDGPERERLSSMAGQLGIERQVFFLGNVSHSRIFDYYEEADIFLSLYDLSNLGNPLMEAMRCGKPVVTIRNGGTATVVEHGTNGILLEKGEPAEVSNAVAALLKDPDERRRLGQNAAAYAQEKLWTWEERLSHELAAVEALVR